MIDPDNTPDPRPGWVRTANRVAKVLATGGAVLASQAEPAPTDDVAPSTCVNCGHVGTYHDDGPCGRGIGGGEICGCENYEASAWPAPTDDFVLADHVYMEAPDDADYRHAPTDDVAADRDMWRRRWFDTNTELAAARAEAERLRYASLDWQDKYHALRRQVAAVRAVRAWVEEQSGPLDQQAAFYDANVRAALDTEETP